LGGAQVPKPKYFSTYYTTSVDFNQTWMKKGGEIVKKMDENGAPTPPLLPSH
jgi:hypothetical protein